VTESAPKLFISYSWTSQSHEEWVLSLATELRESGVDVILDKWDLKEGHDANDFMEKMVKDPEIKKVALICDRMYAEKADGRSGGVGTETQIISAEIYAAQDQTKFVAILPERDEDGKPFLPTYYKSRIYIDLSNPDLYGRNFEQLLRWVYDKPLHVRPELGKTPAFLSDEGIPSLETTPRFRRALEAIRQNRAYCGGAINEYFETFGQNLERFRIGEGEGEFDDKVVRNVEEFLSYRNEAIELFLALAQYRPTQETWEALHRFFEKLIPYLYRPEEARSYLEWDFDNFKFIIHELFLYVIAALLKYECFLGVAYLVRQHYYVFQNARRGNESMVPYSVFRDYLRSLEHRNKRLKLRRLSLRADLIEQRSKSSGLAFEHVMQADLVLFIRDCLDSLRSEHRQSWWPETLLYAHRHYGPFELFARSQSKQYFKKVRPIFDIESKDEILPLAEAFRENRLRMPQWEFESFDLFGLMAFDKLATLP
jgi:hypothetical protein